MKKCVIIGGADIGDYARARSFLSDDDYYVFCDSGLRHAKPLLACADLIVGDFDSHENPHSTAETIVLPTVKDDTDTVYAVKEALRRGFTDFLLLGVIGQRLDHTLGNVSILLMLDTAGASGLIVDDYSELSVVSRFPAYVSDEYDYFSLISIDGTVRGIRVRNAKYPLEDAVMTPDYQYGVSNEPIKGESARITVKEGRLLLVKIPGREGGI